MSLSVNSLFMAGCSGFIDSLSFDLRSDCSCVENFGDDDDNDAAAAGESDDFDLGAGNETGVLIG